MANFYARYPFEGGGTSVTSIDGITGAVTLVAGSGITITDNSPVAGSITIASTSSGDVTLTNVGSTPNAKGASLVGQALTLQPANTSFPGVLLAADWNTFNSKQSTITIGALDAQAENATGLALVANALSAQSADATHPGMVNITTQTFAGQKTFSTGLTGALTGHSTLDLALTGGTMSGAISMGSNKITSVTDPTSAQDAATKNYVDSVASGLNPIQATYAASTANIAGTYSNGVAGVGATFTITATGALSLDGVSPPVLSRVLLKNQTSGFQNGVYDVTVVGTTGVSPVLTRSLDYNTASNMNAGDLIPVINGTANGTTSWLQTATITTVGTDSLVFSEWTANPASYLLKANNLSDVSSTQTSLNNLAAAVTSGFYLRGNGTNVVLAAIQAGDVPTLNQNTSGTAAGLSVTLIETKGGTNQSTYATGDTLYASAANTLSKLGKGTSGQVLGQGASIPAWVNPPIPQFVLGSTDSTRRSTSNTTFTVTTGPTVSITATYTGTYQVSGVVSLGNTTSGKGTYGQIQASTGSPTVLYQQISQYIAAAAGYEGAGPLNSYYTLTAGQSYTFSVYIKTDSGGGASINNDNEPAALTVRQVA